MATYMHAISYITLQNAVSGISNNKFEFVWFKGMKFWKGNGGKYKKVTKRERWKRNKGEKWNSIGKKEKTKRTNKQSRNDANKEINEKERNKTENKARLWVHSLWLSAPI
jgi:hypothetical protein